jgi:hypothetical protein
MIDITLKRYKIERSSSNMGLAITEIVDPSIIDKGWSRWYEADQIIQQLVEENKQLREENELLQDPKRAQHVEHHQELSLRIGDTNLRLDSLERRLSNLERDEG